MPVTRAPLILLYACMLGSMVQMAMHTGTDQGSLNYIAKLSSRLTIVSYLSINSANGPSSHRLRISLLRKRVFSELYIECLHVSFSII